MMRPNRLVLVAAAVLAVVARAAPVHNAQAQHAVLIGVDGLTLNPTCVPAGHLPNIEALMQNGSYTIRGRSTLEAVSGPGWSTFLCAMPPPTTGVISNSWTPPWEEKVDDVVHPVEPATGVNERFPCVFDVARNTISRAGRIVAYYDWNFLQYLIDSKSTDVNQFCDPHELSWAECDEISTSSLINDISADMPTLSYIYFGDLDESGGHGSGWCSDTYLSISAKIDGQIGRIVSAIQAAGKADDTLIVLSADHGGAFGTRMHGLQRTDNIQVPFIAVGPGIKRNYPITYEVGPVDVSATAVTALGGTCSPWWKGRLPEEILA